MGTRNFDSSDLIRLTRDRTQFSFFSQRSTEQTTAKDGVYVRGINPQTGVTAQSSVNNLNNGDYTTYYRAFPTTVVSVPYNTLNTTPQQRSEEEDTPIIIPGSFTYSFNYAGAFPGILPISNDDGSLIDLSYSYVVNSNNRYVVTVTISSFDDTKQSARDGITFYVASTFYGTTSNLTILQFGQIPIARGTYLGLTFGLLPDFTISSTDSPIILSNTSFAYAFVNCYNFNSDISNWNTTNVISMNNAFFAASSFNQNLSNWNTSAVTRMDSMFYNATAFNNGQAPGGTTAPLNWNTASVGLPVTAFRTGSNLTAQNAVNSSNQLIGN